MRQFITDQEAEPEMNRGRKTRIRAAALTLAVAAVAALLALPAFAANGGTDRPYKISGTQTGTWDFTNDPFQFDMIGPAIASHLGKTTVRSFGSSEGSISIYTAANGDELHGTGAPAPDAIPDGFVCPAMPGYGGLGGPYPYADNNTYDGGTGRFANAHGTSVSVGCVYFSESGTNFASWPAIVTYSEKGTLSY